MLVIGINYACGWVQILSEKCYTLTCPMKQENGKLYFYHKSQWWSVEEYASDTLKASNYDGLGKNKYY